VKKNDFFAMSSVLWKTIYSRPESKLEMFDDVYVKIFILNPPQEKLLCWQTTFFAEWTILTVINMKNYHSQKMLKPSIRLTVKQLYTRWTVKMQKIQIPTSKLVDYEFIRAWNIWKTSNIAALIIDVLYNPKIPQKSSLLWVKFDYFTFKRRQLLHLLRVTLYTSSITSNHYLKMTVHQVWTLGLSKDIKNEKQHFIIEKFLFGPF